MQLSFITLAFQVYQRHILDFDMIKKNDVFLGPAGLPDQFSVRLPTPHHTLLDTLTHSDVDPSSSYHTYGLPGLPYPPSYGGRSFSGGREVCFCPDIRSRGSSHL